MAHFSYMKKQLRTGGLLARNTGSSSTLACSMGRSGIAFEQLLGLLGNTSCYYTNGCGCNRGKDKLTPGNRLYHLFCRHVLLLSGIDLLKTKRYQYRYST